jgi:hypothetical protein
MHDPADSLVDRVPAEPIVDHGLAHPLELERAELCGNREAVEFPDRPERVVEVIELVRLATVRGPVVSLCMLPESGQDLVDGQVRVRLAPQGSRDGVRACGFPASKPFRNEPLVFGPTLGAAIGPAIMVAPIQGHDGPAARFVLAK